MSLVIWKRFVLGQTVRSRRWSLWAACMHASIDSLWQSNTQQISFFLSCSVNPGCAWNQSPSTLQQKDFHIQSLESLKGCAWNYDHPAHCNKIFHDCELGIASDKDAMSGILLHFICTWAPNKKKTLILLLSVVIKNIEGWLKIFTSYVGL